MSATETAETTAATEQRLTGEELFARGDLGPCELVDGRIVPMTPTGGEHAFLEFELARVLGNFVAGRGLGWLVGGEVGIYTRRNPDRVRGADIAFFSRERLPERPGRKYLSVAPDLVVEIVSPGDLWTEVRQKVEEYFGIGAGRVWVVQPEDSSVLVFSTASTSTRLAGSDILRGEGTLEGFVLSLTELFGGQNAPPLRG
jgi:Uma2 family endonuclease